MCAMSPRLLRPLASGIHPEAADWRARVVANFGTVSGSTLQAVSRFCARISAAGIRDRFARLNLFCGDNLNAALVPLYRNRAAYSGRNLIADNENYLGSSYTYSRFTPTSGGVGPTGGPVLTMTETADTGVHVWRTNYSIPITVGATYTWSVYVKDVTNGLIVLRDNSSSVALFDVSAESVVASTAGATGSIADAGGGWYRLSIEFSAVSNPGEFTVSGAPDGHSTATLPSYTGDTGHSFTLSAPQLEAGSLTAYDLNTTLGNATDTNNAFVGVGTDYAETGASGGLTGNGTSKYLNTGLSISDLPDQRYGHMATYNVSFPEIHTSSRWLMGSRNSASTVVNWLNVTASPASPTGQYRRVNWSRGGISVTDTSEAGDVLYAVSRTAAGEDYAYQNAAKTALLATPVSTAMTEFLPVFAINAGGGIEGFYDRSIASYSIGNGLTEAQMATYRIVLASLMSSLGRVST